MVKRNMILFMVLGLAVLLLSGCFGWSYQVSGRVLDYTGAGIPDVTISFETQSIVNTDANGYWSSTLKGYDQLDTELAKEGWVFSPSQIKIQNNYELTTKEIVFMGIPTDQRVTISDPELEAKVYASAGKDLADSLYGLDVVKIDSLSASGGHVTSLSGIEYLIGLETLNLSGNQITDFTPLTHLRNVSDLSLSNNGLSDLNLIVEPLRNMTVQWLDLDTNGITDLSPLTEVGFRLGLGLSVAGNEISDLSPLADIPELWSVSAGSNVITDLTPLADQNLGYLRVSENSIKDISVVADMDRMIEFAASNNRITDISSLAGLKELERVEIGYNLIQDIGALQDLDKIKYLVLEGNVIRDFSVLLTLDALEFVDISENGLDLSEGSEVLEIIDQLESKGVEVIYNEV